MESQREPLRFFRNVYWYTVESILTGCIMAWYGNFNSQEHKWLQRVVDSVQSFTGKPSPTSKASIWEATSRWQHLSKIPTVQALFLTLCYHQAGGTETKTPQVQEQLLFNKHQFLQLTCFFNWPAPPHLILHCGKPLEHSWTGFLIAFCTNVMFFHMLFRFHCLNNLWRINVLGFCLCLWCCCKQYLHCICTSGYDKKFNMTWSLYPAWHLKAWM